MTAEVRKDELSSLDSVCLGYLSCYVKFSYRRSKKGVVKLRLGKMS